jgi:hypothetical protein
VLHGPGRRPAFVGEMLQIRRDLTTQLRHGHRGIARPRSRRQFFA